MRAIQPIEALKLIDISFICRKKSYFYNYINVCNKCLNPFIKTFVDFIEGFD